MPPDRRSLTLVRWIDAPPARVYAALTDPQKILRWWSPDLGPTVSATADVRAGGGFRVVFRTEDGQEHTNDGVYREVVPGETLVFSWHWLETTERESRVIFTLDTASRWRGSRTPTAISSTTSTGSRSSPRDRVDRDRRNATDSTISAQGAVQ